MKKLILYIITLLLLAVVIPASGDFFAGAGGSEMYEQANRANLI